MVATAKLALPACGRHKASTNFPQSGDLATLAEGTISGIRPWASDALAHRHGVRHGIAMRKDCSAKKPKKRLARKRVRDIHFRSYLHFPSIGRFKRPYPLLAALSATSGLIRY